LKVISLGAGIQSTTMYLMSCRGELPRADVAVFADTGWEPAQVYEHLERLKALNEIPIEVVSIGNIREDALGGGRFASMPLYVKDDNGKVGMLRRQCTREYKVTPIQKKCRELGATAKNPFEVWIGISVDEIQRMKDSFVKYTQHVWPLIDLRWDRQQCKNWLNAHWEHPVGKSACIGCPFRDNAGWRALTPEEMADAIEFDEAVRRSPKIKEDVFLHRSGVPLKDVDFSEDGQMDMFGEECEGYCGL
jgi:hypothetical protein